MVRTHVLRTEVRRGGHVLPHGSIRPIAIAPTRPAAPPGAAPPYEARIRVAARVTTADEAELIVHEVDALGLNRPAGGSFAATGVREVLDVASTFVPRA